MRKLLITIILADIFLFSLCNYYDEEVDAEEPEVTIVEPIKEEINIFNYTTYLEADLDEISKLDTENWFIGYKNILEKYHDILDPPETIYDYYSDSDIYLIERCIETETYDMDFESKCNVVSVILNRIEHEEFPNDVDTAITSDGQFSYWRKEISDSTVLALEYVFMFGDTTDGAVYFHSNKKTEKFNKAYYSFTDEAGHHFYVLEE